MTNINTANHAACSPRRRGFASFTAVVLIGTSAIALTAVAGVTIRQAQRTRDAAADAQLRQLLLAGQAHLAGVSPDDQEFSDGYMPALPDRFAGDGASLLIRAGQGGPSPVTATVTAECRGRTASQTFAYDPEHGEWRVTEVQMP
jgi:hypothetical protein